MDAAIAQLHADFLVLAQEHLNRHEAYLRGERVREGGVEEMRVPAGQTEELYVEGKKFMVNALVAEKLKSLTARCAELEKQLKMVAESTKT